MGKCRQSPRSRRGTQTPSDGLLPGLLCFQRQRTQPHGTRCGQWGGSAALAEGPLPVRGRPGWPRVRHLSCGSSRPGKGRRHPQAWCCGPDGRSRQTDVQSNGVSLQRGAGTSRRAIGTTPVIPGWQPQARPLHWDSQASAEQTRSSGHGHGLRGLAAALGGFTQLELVRAYWAPALAVRANWYSPQSHCPSRTCPAPCATGPGCSWRSACRAPGRGEQAGHAA